MIKHFRVQNYKALRDVRLDLTPIHVLIGPNDSGKTSILEAIAALCRSVDLDLSQSFTGSWDDRSLVWQRDPQLLVSLGVVVSNGQPAFDYSWSCRFAPTGRQATIVHEQLGSLSDFDNLRKAYGEGAETMLHRLVQGHQVVVSDDIRRGAHLAHDALTGIHYYRWHPRFLALPVAPDSSRRFRMEPSGFGLALCLDDILGYDRDLFIQLENRFKRVFPNIKSIKLLPEQAYLTPALDPTQIPQFKRAAGKGVHFQFVGSDKLVPAAQASDGMLLILAYLTILSLPQPPRVILVEEPENGIHPKRLEEITHILRDLVGEQGRSQVVLTTHSPYLVDLFGPEEVSLCRKGDDGAVTVQRLSNSRTVREQLDVFTLGEIWTAEGDDKLAQPAPAAGGPAS